MGGGMNLGTDKLACTSALKDQRSSRTNDRIDNSFLPPARTRVTAVLSCAVCARIYYKCARIVGEGEST